MGRAGSHSRPPHLEVYMRKAISILAGSLLAVGALAGDAIDMVSPAVFTAVATNTSAVSTSRATAPVKVSGWLDAVIIDVGGSPSPTNTIVVKTAGSESTGPSRVLLTLTDVAADGTYPARDLVTDVTGSDISDVPARHALVGDTLIVDAYAANTTTNTLTVYLILDKDN